MLTVWLACSPGTPVQKVAYNACVCLLSALQSSLKERYDATKGATGKTYDDWSKQARLEM